MAQNVSEWGWQWWASLVSAIFIGIGALLAPSRLWQRLKTLGKWLMIPALIGLVVLFLYYLPKRYDPELFDGGALPDFVKRQYWTWMLVCLLTAIGSTWSLVSTLRGRRPVAAEPAGDGPSAAFADIDAAWDDILLRLDAIDIDLATQEVFLLLAPDEDRVAALIESAGMPVFARAPDVDDAPVHAYKTAEGVLLSLTGASAFGTGDASGSARLEYVFGKLLGLRPDCPVVRGLAVLLPIDWAARSDSVARAAAIREDLRVVRQTLKLSLPVFALFPGMEAVPGFPELIDRMVDQVSPEMRSQRVGFSIPRSSPFGGDLIGRGLTWQSDWFHRWTLNLMAGRPFEEYGNAALVALDHEFRRYRKRLRAVLEQAFMTPREVEPVLFRGCYFMATGRERADRAYTAGLLAGPRSRVIADGIETTWSAEAWADDRRYRRIAWAVGLIGVGLCVPAWGYVVRGAPAWVAAAGIGSLVVAWVGGLVWVRRVSS